MIVVDANIMLGALIGRSLPLIAQLAEKVPVVSPPTQLAEVRRVLLRLSHHNVDEKMRLLLQIVEPVSVAVFAGFEEAARARLHTRGQSDWPILAAALALGAGIWSRDGDLFGTGVPLWFTRNIRFVEAAPASLET